MDTSTQQNEVCSNPDCSAPISWASDICHACHAPLPPPNVRAAVRQQQTMLENAKQAYDACCASGKSALADAFLLEVAENSHAVINGDVKFFLNFFSDTRQLYSTYVKQTAATIRTVAEFKDDARRRATEVLVFGDCGAEIRYAALSLDQRGLYSYGACCMRLKPKLCARSASVCIENTYKLVDRAPEAYRQQKDVPQGQHASWEQRQQLALAKLGPSLQAGMQKPDFAALLLQCDGRRETDEFMEVHIYREFSCHAVAQVYLPAKGARPLEQAELMEMRGHLQGLGIPCQE